MLRSLRVVRMRKPRKSDEENLWSLRCIGVLMLFWGSMVEKLANIGSLIGGYLGPMM